MRPAAVSRKIARLTKPADAPQPDEPDSLLIQKVKDGDQSAFEALFHRHMARVHRQALALLNSEAEAEEVVQEVFITVYTKAQQFRGEAAFSTWLYRLTANAAISRLRQRQRRREESLEDYLPKFNADGHHLERPVVDWSAEVEASLAGRELQRVLRQALDELAPVDKAVVVMSDLDDLPNRDIANALGLTVPAVKARLHRARLFLRGRLAVHFGHSPA
jgi:RNA polymerase sigma-70 factor (ECF subfamily)